MADEKVNMRAGVPDDQSIIDFGRLDDGADLHAYFSNEHARGNCQFLGVFWGLDRIGTGVFSFLETEKALVCNVLSCAPVEGVNVSLEVANLAIEWAKNIGANVVRFWTARGGLVRKMEAQGFKFKSVGELKIG